MGNARIRTTSEIVHRVLSVTGEVAREHRALQRAIKKIPKPVPWDWAAPRLLPILSGPSFDPPGEPLFRVRSDVGPMVQFAIDLGGPFAYVDVGVAERWECSGDQLMERALENLHERASQIQPERVVFGVLSGRAVRILQDRPTWASSLILAPKELFRLFGDHDQILSTPRMECLISMPLDTPTQIVASIQVDFEARALWPLWLDPFVVEDRQIIWSDEISTEEPAD